MLRALPILAAIAALTLSVLPGPPAHAAECDASSFDANQIGPDEANEIYACLAEEMAALYANVEGIPGVPDYQEWETVSSAPFASTTHGFLLITHVPNPVAADRYKKWEGMIGEKMPVGSIIAKEAIRLTDDGKAVVAQLALMEKVAPGTAPETDDWIYSRIFPNGRIQRTGGPESDKLQFCHQCHKATLEPFDAMYFPQEPYRIPVD